MSKTRQFTRRGFLYGAAGAGHIRIAVVQPDDAMDLVEQRAAR